MIKQNQAAFEAWYDSYDTRTPQDPLDRRLAFAAWQAALESPQVQALRDALRGLLQLDEENHQRYAGDDDVCKEVREARAALAAMEKKAMNKLFSDLKTDEEKSAFFLSGCAHETGIVALAIQNDVAMAYHRCAEYEKEVQALRKDAERYRATRAGLTRMGKDYGARFSAYFDSKGISRADDITEDDFDAATDAAMEEKK